MDSRMVNDLVGRVNKGIYRQYREGFPIEFWQLYHRLASPRYWTAWEGPSHVSYPIGFEPGVKADDRSFNPRDIIDIEHGALHRYANKYSLNTGITHDDGRLARAIVDSQAENFKDIVGTFVYAHTLNWDAYQAIGALPFPVFSALVSSERAMLPKNLLKHPPGPTFEGLTQAVGGEMR
ncbi:hypothetical protein JXB02_04380 [Candidatus Woesearchaeota archaeon]|nr:hypothetical protein [Candidatus Woesearchaeota archaeon]